MLEMCRRALPEELPNSGNLIIIIIINIIARRVAQLRQPHHPCYHHHHHHQYYCYHSLLFVNKFFIQCTNLTFTRQDAIDCVEIIPILISVGREGVHWEHLEQELLRGGESDSQRQPAWPHLRDGLSHLRSPMMMTL